MCVWWNFESVIHWEFIPNGSTAHADLYSQQLEQVHEILRRTYPALVNRNRVLLQQNNARLHTAWTIMIKIQELGGIELRCLKTAVILSVHECNSRNLAISRSLSCEPFINRIPPSYLNYQTKLVDRIFTLLII